MSQQPHIPPSIAVPIEAASVGAIISALIGWLPPIAAALGIIWYCVLIYDRFKWKKKIIAPALACSRRIFL